MAEMLKNQGLVHPSTKYPWLILVMAIFHGPSSMCVNSYQAEGGACLKTFFVGVLLNWLMMMSIMWLWWVLFIGFILGLVFWGIGVFHGYVVMQSSK